MIFCSMCKPTAGKKNHCENWWISAYKNHDLIVISISFLAFNFHGIIRRTSSKYFPLLFPFLIYAKISKRWSNTGGKKSEAWREREKDFELDWQRELFHFISLKDRSRVSSVVTFPPPLPLSLFRRSISVLDHFSSFDHSNFPFLQNNGFCESIKENIRMFWNK